ncbi:MAG: hypothetical protein KIT84_21955 [Labilithrix sp.]|nr:hypothetical protein [Labilithrix sp.]MCW5813709.1 hypothetical protein [Labilithrix sp.]
MRLVVAAALALALAGCSTVIGADFDRPAAPPPDAGASPSTIPVASDGTCPPARKRCGDACALKDDPAFGCAADACAPCAPPADGVASCSALLACDFACAPGFERIGDRCVGFRIEQRDMPELLTITGRGPEDVFVAGGTPYEPARIFHSRGDGKWSPQPVEVDNNRLIFGFANTPTGDLFLASESTSHGEHVMLPLLSVDSGGSWRPNGIGDPPARRTLGVWAASAQEIYTVDGIDVRHYRNGQWRKETTDVVDGRFLWGTSADNVFVIGERGAIAQRWTDGTWHRIVTPTSEMRIGGIWGELRGDRYDVYIVGGNGLVMYSANMREFTVLPTGTTEGFGGVWGTGQDVWVVGGRGTILRGSVDRGFTLVPSGTDAGLLGVWGTSSTNLFVIGIPPGGYSGVILRRS